MPDQLIWGSDFPRLSFHDRVGTIQLYNMLGEWAPDGGMRKRILTDNPAAVWFQRMIPKSGNRFSDKIVRKNAITPSA